MKIQINILNQKTADLSNKNSLLEQELAILKENNKALVKVYNEKKLSEQKLDIKYQKVIDLICSTSNKVADVYNQSDSQFMKLIKIHSEVTDKISSLESKYQSIKSSDKYWDDKLVANGFFLRGNDFSDPYTFHTIKSKPNDQISGLVYDAIGIMARNQKRINDSLFVSKVMDLKNSFEIFKSNNPLIAKKAEQYYSDAFLNLLQNSQHHGDGDIIILGNK